MPKASEKQLADEGLDTYDYLIYAKLNVELMFYSDTDGHTIVCARGRPWKNAAEEGQMLVATGYNSEEALENLCEEHVEGNWLLLDWRFRPGAAGAVQPPKPILRKKPAISPATPSRPERLRATLEGDTEETHTSTPKRA